MSQRLPVHPKDSADPKQSNHPDSSSKDSPVSQNPESLPSFSNDRRPLTPDHLIHLQHTIGNRAVHRLVSDENAAHSASAPKISQTNPVLQRDVVLDDDPLKVVLDRFNRLEEAAQVITGKIVEQGYRENPKGDSPGFDSIYDEVLHYLKYLKAGDAFVAASLTDPATQTPISQFASYILKNIIAAHARDEKHNAWLKKEFNAQIERLQEGLSNLLPLLNHDQTFSKDAAEVFKHYNFFDPNMLWRFTSTPSTESIFIKGGTSYQTILQVIANHSGGNDKSNPDVKTLSFGRNLGALIGTSMSQGGDRHVSNIADKAAYLFGIDINSLKGKGITAHPAQARAISLFETEYVLVSTPGNPPYPLNDLATVKYENPFNGQIKPLLHEVNPGLDQDFAGIELEMGTKTPELVEQLKNFPEALVDDMTRYAKAVAAAANKFSERVQDKEPIRPTDIDMITKNIKEYIALIEKRF